MTDVLLVNPHWYMAEGNLDDLWLPVPGGILAVAAAVREAGYSVMILDALSEGYYERVWTKRAEHRVCRIGLPDEVLLEKIRSSAARVIGIGNMFTGVFRGAMECASMAAKALPGATIVLGGVHPSCAPEESADVPSVDYIVCGEGEESFVKLLGLILRKENTVIPPGVYWRDKETGTVKSSGPPLQIADIARLPLPAWDLLDIKRYSKVAEADLIQRGKNGELTVPIITSRGCPYGCIFCAAHRLNGRQLRGRSPERVVDEIEFLHQTYGIRSFSIEDSNFSYDEERAVAICDEIQKRGLEIRWNTPNGLRADRVTPRLIGAMKRSGCYDITLAAEHGDQEFLNKVIHKSLDLEDVVRAGTIIRKAGLPVSCFLMMGFPGETERELKKTLLFGRRLARAGIFPLYFICSPYPGTDIYVNVIKNESRVVFPEDYLCAVRVSLIPMLSTIDLAGWRHTAMIQSYLLLLLFHPITFVMLPATRKLIRGLLSLKTFHMMMKKLYNQFVLKHECPSDTGDVQAAIAQTKKGRE